MWYYDIAFMKSGYIFVMFICVVLVLFFVVVIGLVWDGARAPSVSVRLDLGYVLFGRRVYCFGLFTG